MKKNEFVKLYHDSGDMHFREMVFPTLVNAYWTSTGESYYPCILLEDNQSNGLVSVVTKNLSIMSHPRTCVVSIPTVERG